MTGMRPCLSLPGSTRILVLIVTGLLPASALALTQSELDAGRELWASQELVDYDYRMQRTCTCIGDATRPGIVAVRGDEILSVTDASSFVFLDPRYFLTVDELFDLLQDALDVDAFHVTADFDAVLGYPRSLFIDYDQFIADEEAIYQAEGLVPAPEPTAAALAALLALAALRVPRQARRPAIRSRRRATPTGPPRGARGA
jgi:hypothetical protein